MKGTIQMYGMLIVFMMLVLILPQLIAFSVIFNQCNESATYIVETIEVNEGINTQSQDEINKFINDYPSLRITLEETPINDRFKSYNVKVERDWKITVLNYTFTTKATKKTKRILR